MTTTTTTIGKSNRPRAPMAADPYERLAMASYCGRRRRIISMTAIRNKRSQLPRGGATGEPNNTRRLTCLAGCCCLFACLLARSLLTSGDGSTSSRPLELAKTLMM